jgi:hypothetical protein
MLIRFVWPDCAHHSDKPVDAFWVECDEGEARRLLSPGADLPRPGAPSGAEQAAYCFLIARDRRFVQPMPWTYPYSGLWNAYNPFRTLPFPISIDSLTELEHVPILDEFRTSLQSSEKVMTQFAAAGSQRWLQVAIESKPDLLHAALRPALALSGEASIVWHSPRAADGFREYRDVEALRRLGIESLPRIPLKDYWPQRGPVWDALGKSTDGQLIFVEAKAHIAELVSAGTKAAAASLERIEASLAEARRYYAPKSAADWTGPFYQYANRLAHHYFFRTVNGLPSHLVFLYFINAVDMAGPETQAEWHGAIRLLHATLGLGEELKDPYVHEVFLDVALLRDAV